MFVVKSLLIPSLFLQSIFHGIIYGAPDQGKFKVTLTKGSEEAFFPKPLYKDSTIKITVVKSGECSPSDATLNLKWLLRSSSCYSEYGDMVNPDSYMENPYTPRSTGGDGIYLNNGNYGDKIDCSATAIILKNHRNDTWIKYPEEIVNTTKSSTSTGNSRRKRDDSTGTDDKATGPEDDSKDDGKTAPVSPADSPDKPKETPSQTSKEPKNDSGKPVSPSPANPESPEDPKITDKPKETPPKPVTEKKPDENPPAKTEAKNGKPQQKSSVDDGAKNHIVAVTPIEAPYLLVIRIEGAGTKNFSYDVTVEMKSPKGYLSAHQYPLLTFYMIMCIIYGLYATAWLVMSACNFRDLLRVQFWIGGVILLGMIEKAVFYSEYLSVNSTGVSVPGAAKFAEVVSALKRALARMLVIIVSLGFGIVKPRLGPMLHRVIGVGMLFFLLAVIESLVRADSTIRDFSNSTLLFATIPLAVLDAVICWWIFMSLMQTMKTLRLRRNVVKLSLYRHFSNTIIFCILASFIMLFWSNHHDACFSDWQEIWLEDAFWHILFSVILLVIMVLWRPNINNQRYAFSPLIDGGEDEEEAEEPMLGGGATESVKMRGLKNVSEHQPLNKTEDDLKWIEENIPQTVADAALPAIMDSDEEVMTTKYEMSKME